MKSDPNSHPLIALLFGAAIFLSSPIKAGDVSGKEITEPIPDSISSFDFDSLWNRAVLYEDDTNPLLKKLSFTGRLHYDYANLDADQGDYDDWNERRFRLGLKSTIFGNLILKTEAEFDINDAEPFYERLTDAYLQWNPNDEITIKIGKQGAKFTGDGATSSNKLITMERNNLSNNVWFSTLFIPGAQLDYKKGPWRTSAGIYTGGSASPEFGDFDGSTFEILRVGYDFAEQLNVEEALLSLDYVYQDPDTNNSFTRPHEHVGSVNFQYDTGPWGFRSDVAASDGFGGQSDLFGVMVMPFINFSDEWQLVGRYTFIDSADDNGIRFSRYENQIVSGRGDEYHEFYLGVNRYFYGHKLKWQTGLQFVDMSDNARDGGTYYGWGVTSGIRISW